MPKGLKSEFLRTHIYIKHTNTHTHTHIYMYVHVFWSLSFD